MIRTAAALIALAGAAQAAELMTMWRAGSGNYQQRPLTAIPGYVLSFDSLGRPAIVPMATGSGSGDVVGPASSTTGAFPLFVGSTGKILSDSIYTPAHLLSRANHTGTQAAATITGLAPSATIDTTNATNITTGTLGAARLPAPTTTTLGGVKRNTGAAGEYVSGIDAVGTLIYGTPAGGGGGITTPGTTVVGDVVAWNNTTGTALQQTGIAKTDLALLSAQNTFIGVKNTFTTTNLPAVVVSQSGAGGKAAAFLAGGSGAGVTFDSAGTFFLSSATNATVTGTPGSSGTYYFWMDGSNGWVGLGTGTATPTARLDVNGTVKATAFVGDGSGITGLAGGGDVVGPATAINTRLASFNGGTGKIIADSGWSAVTLLDRANHTGTQAASTIGSGVMAAARLGTGIADATTFLRGDGSWQTPAGTGDVVGPASAIGTRFASFNGTTGKLIADSGWSSSTILARANHTGTQSADTLTDGTTNVAFLATERTKLTGIATGATANSSDAFLLDRANHTGTQAAGTITGLATSATTDATNASNITSGTLATARYTRTGVRRTLYVNAGAMIPRTTAGAATGTVELGTNDIMQDSMDFDSATEEGVGFWATLPSAWDASTVTAKFHWTAASSTGTVEWDIAARAFADDDAMDQALGTEQTAGADTLLAVGDMHISPTTPALTVGGSPAANRPIYFQVTRDVAVDTLAADAKLLGVTIEFTESATEPAAQ